MTGNLRIMLRTHEPTLEPRDSFITSERIGNSAGSCDRSTDPHRKGGGANMHQHHKPEQKQKRQTRILTPER